MDPFHDRSRADRRAFRAMPGGPPRDRILVAGGAGFIGSNLVDALPGAGAEVVVLDSLLTGRAQNLAHLKGRPGFDFVRHDVVEPLPAAIRERRFTRIYNLACAASPPHYQKDPEHRLLTNVLGTRHLLRLAEKQGARFLLTSTSEVYGDPEIHPSARIIAAGSTAPGRAPAMTRASALRRP